MPTTTLFDLPATMTGVQLKGYGGFEALEYRQDLPLPEVGEQDVLIQVAAAGINNTDINSRTGWYAKTVTSGTTAEGGSQGFDVAEGGMGDWTGDLAFPRIQGADCLGRVVAIGDKADASLLGQTVLVQPYFYDPADPQWRDKVGFLGAEYDGAFAQFTAAPAHQVSRLPENDLSPEQLATLPCSGGTAMNMLLAAGIAAGDRVLVTGASGGVGSFLVQIAKHKGAKVVALANPSKADPILAIGAHAVIDRKASDWAKQAQDANDGQPFSLVADVVGGAIFPDLLSLLARGGRYVTAGAIAGPNVALDLRTLYLKSLSFFGSAAYEPQTFPALLEVLGQGGLKPLVAGVRPLADIQAAQEAFLQKTHVGSYVLIPPPLAA